MDAADAAGGEDTDARQLRDHHGGGHGGGAGEALREVDGHVPAADLAHVLGPAHELQLLAVEADLQLAADDGGGGGDGALGPDDLLHLVGELQVLGIGHAVGEDGGLQGHHGAALVQSLLHFGSNVQVFVQRHVRFLHIVRF